MEGTGPGVECRWGESEGSEGTRDNAREMEGGVNMGPALIPANRPRQVILCFITDAQTKMGKCFSLCWA